MKKLVIFLVCFTVVVAFSVFCYGYFKKHDISVLENKSKTDSQKIGMLSLAMDIIPSNQKNEILYNSVKQKFPDLDQYPDIAKMIWPEVKIEQDTQKKESSLELTSAYDTTILSAAGEPQQNNKKKGK